MFVCGQEPGHCGEVTVATQGLATVVPDGQCVAGSREVRALACTRADHDASFRGIVP